MVFIITRTLAIILSWNQHDPTMAAALADIGGEELAQRCGDWSLQQDKQLLELLKSFSANVVDRAKRVEEKMDDLACKTNETKVRLNNTLNEFLMLTNTQFIENRVYDDDGVDHDAVEAEAKAKEEEEKRAAKMDPSQVQVRWKAALAAGLGALAFKVRVLLCP